MLTGDFTKYVHHAEHIKITDVQHAYWYLVAFGAHSNIHDCKIYEKANGSFRFYNVNSNTYWYSFLITKKHLTFYFRESYFRESQHSIRLVERNFGNRASLTPNKKELKIHVVSVDTARQITDFLIGASTSFENSQKQINLDDKNRGSDTSEGSKEAATKDLLHQQSTEYEHRTTNSSLEDSIEKIYAETRKRWENYRNRCSEVGKWGYEILNAPPEKSCPVFILSENPGSTEDDSYPTSWKLEPGYPRGLSELAERLIELFDGCEAVKLKNCGAGFRLFFRSPSVSKWKACVPADIRKDAEEFSLSRIQQILFLTEPKSIVTIGKSAFKKICDVEEKDEEIVRPWGARQITLIRYGQFKDIPIIGVPHLSGVRLSGKHRVEIKQKFEEFVSKNLV
jgi:hypothetical protein